MRTAVVGALYVLGALAAVGALVIAVLSVPYLRRQHVIRTLPDEPARRCWMRPYDPSAWDD